MVDPRNKLNDLNATEWVSRTVSVVTQRGHGKQSQLARYEKLHPAPFSYQDISRFIEMFSKRGEYVFDPFAGVGSTLKAAMLLGRNAQGVELYPKFTALARERINEEVDENIRKNLDHCLITDDIRLAIPKIKDESIDFIVTSPPYWNILDKVDHKVKQERLANGLDYNYGIDDADLSKIESYQEFVNQLASIFANLCIKLKHNRYAVIVVSDFRNKDRYFLYHSDLVQAIEALSAFRIRGITIIYQKFKRVYPYGYPYSFVPNIHHQYALVLQNTMGRK